MSKKLVINLTCNSVHLLIFSSTHFVLEVPRGECVHVQELEPVNHRLALRLRLDHVREDDVVLEALHGVRALVPRHRLVRAVLSELLVVTLVVNLEEESTQVQSVSR